MKYKKDSLSIRVAKSNIKAFGLASGQTVPGPCQPRECLWHFLKLILLPIKSVGKFTLTSLQVVGNQQLEGLEIIIF